MAKFHNTRGLDQLGPSRRASLRKDDNYAPSAQRVAAARAKNRERAAMFGRATARKVKVTLATVSLSSVGGEADV